MPKYKNKHSWTALSLDMLQKIALKMDSFSTITINQHEAKSLYLFFQVENLITSETASSYKNNNKLLFDPSNLLIHH